MAHVIQNTIRLLFVLCLLPVGLPIAVLIWAVLGDEGEKNFFAGLDWRDLWPANPAR